MGRSLAKEPYPVAPRSLSGPSGSGRNRALGLGFLLDLFTIPLKGIGRKKPRDSSVFHILMVFDKDFLIYLVEYK
jgi:hypothetical protein